MDVMCHQKTQVINLQFIFGGCNFLHIRTKKSVGMGVFDCAKNQQNCDNPGV
jgi:hypothetical protein